MRTHQKNPIQSLQNLLFSKPVAKDLPFILLFYGEGGMGKTRLIRRLEEIAEKVRFLDTYEIVDRLECDYTLRSVIQHSSKRIEIESDQDRLVSIRSNCGISSSEPDRKSKG